MSKVFGIGYHRTGTTTLAHCLTHLGYHCQPYTPRLLEQIYQGDFSETFATVNRYDAFRDWPWPLIFRELYERYPDAKYILTVRRDEATWMNSLSKHAAKKGPSRMRELIYGYSLPDGQEALHIAKYQAHNEAVIDFFQQMPHKLLTICWETGSGWPELCAFLDKPVPNVALPHQNASLSYWGIKKRNLRRLTTRARRRLVRTFTP
ncbi:MAG: hypothetical protein KDE04_01110 [Anaerolineales bacterium]|nr:hypothetical protein [Anaerolineales bacterium]MCB0027271.1 hypothetical protein [Anaerolineales bacterium]